MLPPPKPVATQKMTLHHLEGDLAASRKCHVEGDFALEGDRVPPEGDFPPILLPHTVTCSALLRPWLVA